jgi:hypothetical protein
LAEHFEPTCENKASKLDVDSQTPESDRWRGHILLAFFALQIRKVVAYLVAVVLHGDRPLKAHRPSERRAFFCSGSDSRPGDRAGDSTIVPVLAHRPLVSLSDNQSVHHATEAGQRQPFGP